MPQNQKDKILKECEARIDTTLNKLVNYLINKIFNNLILNQNINRAPKQTINAHEDKIERTPNRYQNNYHRRKR